MNPMKIPIRSLSVWKQCVWRMETCYYQRTFIPKRSISDNNTSCNAKEHPILFVDEIYLDAISSDSRGDFVEERLSNSIRPYFEKQLPVVIRGAVVATPAIDRWSDLSPNAPWAQDLSPRQTGGVELGGSYSSSSSERAEIPIIDYLQYLKMFVERHGGKGDEDPWEPPQDISPDELVYMAQNDLPEPLYKDIFIPAFCEDEKWNVGHGRLYSVMFWLGPRGCVSPLHFDPLDNVLMQFVGRKAVWLFEPQSKSADGGMMWQYAGHEGQQSNTSPVNPENVDDDKYPMFRRDGPRPLRCVLTPGDFLYIPKRWWHFVRSVDTSASVNVWWR